ncbi:single-stranded DNA-binding protein [Dactylosporangium sp. McL0621]|uniref:single-stranded DNA-binding protein n=1 Tax=Dactylosporangium sp. McL0621 TaxID=3415678 RepID=UPI003CE86437
MFETKVTVVGNVLNTPDCRRLVDDNQTLVASFKVASTSRRFDRGDGRWVDGDSLRMRVNCWRQLAENVARSVQVGDPVIVTGRLYSRDWETEDHVRRVSYELDAHTVGHDLSRGRAKFARIRAHTATSSIDDELGDARIGDAPTVPADDINGLPRRQAFDPELGGVVTLVEDGDPFAEEILASLAASDDLAAAFETATPSIDSPDSLASPDSSGSPDSSDSPDSDSVDSDEVEEEEAAEAGPGPRARRRPRTRVPAGV